MKCVRECWLVVVALLLCGSLSAQDGAAPTTDQTGAWLKPYFAHETEQLQRASLADVEKIDDWTQTADESRRRVREMLGIDPLPPRTDLHVTVTGTIDHPEFTAEKLHFQSLPGLYVTGNLYVPKGLTEKVPAILYVCGHGNVIKNGISYGSKSHYQHHGAWFARNGYVCLVIDTLQLGEIQGIHHGTYREGRWWWLSRGYTPAGVEAWNGMRSLDYLQSRPEVDPQRLGVTGRSGGGAYSWWLSAADERIQAAVPVAGITDLTNHVVDGCVEGHCDCMFMVNTYRWDYPQVAALNYPRALLVSNTDRDRIFPLDGVYRTYMAARRLYDLGNHPNEIAFNITAGGHLDTQELQIHAMRWFDQHLKGEDKRIVRNAAEKLFEPEQLKVFAELPSDQLNTRIDEVFVPQAEAPSVPANNDQWESLRDRWLTALQEKSFNGWPAETVDLNVKLAAQATKQGLEATRYDFVSQEHVPLSLYVVQRAGLGKADLVVLNTLDQTRWNEFQAMLAPAFTELFANKVAISEAGNEDLDELRQMLAQFPWVMAYVAPRGVGPTQWSTNEKFHTQTLRRFYLLGQTWEGMQTYDIRRAMQAVRSLDALDGVPLWLQAEGNMAPLAAYASLFEPPVKRMDLHAIPASHAPSGPALLNVLKTLDIPQMLALAGERSQVVLYNPPTDVATFAQETAKALNWPAKQVQVRNIPSTKSQ